MTGVQFRKRYGGPVFVVTLMLGAFVSIATGKWSLGFAASCGVLVCDYWVGCFTGTED